MIKILLVAVAVAAVAKIINKKPELYFGFFVPDNGLDGSRLRKTTD